MVLLKSQRNQLFQELLDKGIQPNAFTETIGGGWYKIEFSEPNSELYFAIRSEGSGNEVLYKVQRRPGDSKCPDSSIAVNQSEWGSPSRGVFMIFREWASAIKCEVEGPDLWLETTKAIQLFSAAASPADDKFAIAELGALHGQLRMLCQLFEASELLREYQIELAPLIQTAAVKAETFTKKDWQNWTKGAFISAIVSLELSEEQAQELLALVRLAFGGLFLKQ